MAFVYDLGIDSPHKWGFHLRGVVFNTYVDVIIATVVYTSRVTAGPSAKYSYEFYQNVNPRLSISTFKLSPLHIHRHLFIVENCVVFVKRSRNFSLIRIL